MKKISESDLDKLKSLADGAQQDWEFSNVQARASAYLSIETIQQLKIATRNNLLFAVFGAVLGCISSFTILYFSKSDTEQRLQQLSIEVHEVKLELNNFHKYQFKKDSLETFSKKN